MSCILGPRRGPAEIRRGDRSSRREGRLAWAGLRGGAHCGKPLPAMCADQAGGGRGLARRPEDSLARWEDSLTQLSLSTENHGVRCAWGQSRRRMCVVVRSLSGLGLALATNKVTNDSPGHDGLWEGRDMPA